MKTMTTASRIGVADMFAHMPFGPKIVFAPEDGTGTGTPPETDEVAAAAAAKAAEEKAAAEKAAAEKAAAEKAAAEKAGEENKARDTETEAQKLLREVMEKKSKLKEAEQREADLAAQLRKFDGIDPDAVRAMIEEKRQAELAAEEAKGNFDQVKKMMAEEHERSVKTLKEENTTLTGTIDALKKEIDELTIGRQFSESKYIAEDLAIPRSKARVLYGAHFERVNGEIVGYDKPAGNDKRQALIDASGNPLPFDEAFKRIIEMDPDKDSLLRAKGKPGAGSASQKVRGIPETPKDTGLHGASRIEAGLMKRLKK